TNSEQQKHKENYDTINSIYDSTCNQIENESTIQHQSNVENIDNINQEFQSETNTKQDAQSNLENIETIHQELESKQEIKQENEHSSLDNESQTSIKTITNYDTSLIAQNTISENENKNELVQDE